MKPHADIYDIVVVGNGAAAVSALQEAARRIGRESARRILQVAPEQDFYYRAALTNFLLRRLENHELKAIPSDSLPSVARVNSFAVSMDLANKTIVLANGHAVRYDKLLIASGASAKLPRWFFDGNDALAPGRQGLRSLEDAYRLKAAIERIPARRRGSFTAIVQGGGILGIEVAEAFCHSGMQVHLLHGRPSDQGAPTKASWLLDKVVDAYAGDLIRRVMERDGVTITFNADLAPDSDGSSDGFRLRQAGMSDARVRAHLLVGCTGNEANSSWLAGADIPLKGGLIQVNRAMQVVGCTDVYAAGDIALVDESDQPVANPTGLWKPARYQGRIAGRNMTSAATDALEEYRPGIMLNSTRAWGLSLDSAGLHPDFANKDDPKATGHRGNQPVYKRAVLRNGRLAGFLLLGDRREARALTTLLNLRADGARGSEFDGPILTADIAARLFDPEFDLNAWVDAQAKVAPLRWSRRDNLDDRAGHTVSRQSFVRDDAPSRILGMTRFASNRGKTVSQRPLLLEINGEKAQLNEGPVWIGNPPTGHEARFIDHGLPRETAMRLEPSGIAWLATNANDSDVVRINGTRLSGARVLSPYDVLSVGGWRGIVLPDNEGRTGQGKTPANKQVSYLSDGITDKALSANDVTRIGRLASENDIVLQHALAHEFHAVIEPRDGRYVLRPIGSAMLSIDGRMVRTPEELQNGQRVDFNGSVWTYEARTVEPYSEVEAHSSVVGYLCPENGHDAGHALALVSRNGVVRIGRAPECELQLADTQLSRVHATLRVVGERLLLRDHASANGIRVGEHWLEGDESIEVPDGAMIRMGAHAYRYSRRVSVGMQPATPSRLGTTLSIGKTVIRPRASAQEGASGVSKALQGIRLKPVPNAIFPEGKLLGAELLQEGTLEIGRGPSTETASPNRLQLPTQAERLSRRHAEISVTPSGSFLRDMDSSGGTFLNDMRLGADPLRLKDGDIIGLARIAEYEVELPGLRSAEQSGSKHIADGAGSPIFWAGWKNRLDDNLPAIVSEELDACIGCHECMRECPLPDAQIVTIAALNATAAGSSFTPMAQRFVDACTQCHACVPVCPVGIERSRIVLWNKLKIEPDPNLYPPLQIGNIKDERRLGVTVGEIARDFRNEAIATLGQKDRMDLLSRCQYRLLSPGELLIEAGDYVSTLWLVYEGQVSVSLSLQDEAQLDSLYLDAGATIAARPFLADEQCRHRVIARTETIVIGLPRALVKRYLDRNADFEKALNTLARRIDPVESVSALKHLPEPDRKGQVMWFQPGQRVSGNSGGLLHAVVLRGFVAEHGETNDGPGIIDYHRAGAILDLPRQVTNSPFTSKTTSELLLLSPAAAEYLRGQSPSGAHPVSTRQEAALLGSGKRIMAIDMKLCVDCNNCEDACARRHGQSRMRRQSHGWQLGDFHIPNACYHCQDPKCLMCDVGGIVRTESGEIRIVEENCIGCGACADRCPYGNIEMIEKATKPTKLRFPSLLQLSGLAKLNTKSAEADQRKPDRKASKCDLCSQHADGPACVRACPTGAAQRRSLGEIVAITSGDGS